MEIEGETQRELHLNRSEGRLLPRFKLSNKNQVVATYSLLAASLPSRRPLFPRSLRSHSDGGKGEYTAAGYLLSH